MDFFHHGAALAEVGVDGLAGGVGGEEDVGEPAQGAVLRQGFLGNITNPKMFVFYLSLLPQFVATDAPLSTWLAHALTLPALGMVWLLVVVVLGGTLRERLLRPLARRITDAVSGVALLGFGVRLAAQPG